MIFFHLIFEKRISYFLFYIPGSAARTRAVFFIVLWSIWNTRSKGKIRMENTVLRTATSEEKVWFTQKVEFTFFPQKYRLALLWSLFALVNRQRDVAKLRVAKYGRQRFQRWLWCFWHGTRYSWWLFWCALRFSAGCTWRMYVQSNYKRPSNRERESEREGCPGAESHFPYILQQQRQRAPAESCEARTLNISCSKSTCKFELFTLCFTRESSSVTSLGKWIKYEPGLINFVAKFWFNFLLKRSLGRLCITQRAYF